MKTLLILGLMLLIGVTGSVAQTPIDPPSISSQNAMLIANDTIYHDTISFSDTSIFAGTQKEFMFGHQWFKALSGVNKRLYMNCYNTNEDGLFSDYALNFYRFPRTYDKKSYLSYDIRGSQLGYCYSFQLDPESPPVELWETFVPASNDSLGAIYGFRHKEGGSRGLLINSNRYVYYADSGRSDTGRLILSSPIGSTSYQRLVGTEWPANDIRSNGTQWYLSVNLRRMNAVWNDSTSGDDTVLSIKLPMTYRRLTLGIYDTVFRSIIFDSISSRHNGLADKGYYTRGGWMENKLSPSHDSIFVIRRSMLPKYGDSADITLSAFFRTIQVDSVNPPFRVLVNSQVNEIDSMGMEVRFYGKCNIAIDWLRLETPDTRKLYRGEKDSMIAATVSRAITKIKQFRDTTNGMPNARIWRFYITDEPNPLLVGASRYYSSVLKGFCITEGGGDNRYRQAVPAQPTYWGSTPRFDQYTRAPYIKYVVPGFGSDSVYKKYRDHALNFYAGWQYTHNVIDSSMTTGLKNDIKNLNFMTGTCDSNRDGSAYEKYTFADPFTIKQCSGMYAPWVSSVYGFNYGISSDTAYKYILGNPGLLGIYEYHLNEMMVWGKTTLFSSKPWLANIWIASEWFGIINSDATIKPGLVTGYSRAQTGEEIRLYCWSSLIFGAKGLMYDNFDCELGGGKLWDTSAYHTPSRSWLRMGAMGRYEGLSDSFLKDDDNGEFLLQSDKSGSDYIIHGDSTHIDQYIDFDSSAYALGVNRNRMDISVKRYHPFRRKDTTHFGKRLPPVSVKGYHPFRKKVTTYFGKRLPL